MINRVNSLTPINFSTKKQVNFGRSAGVESVKKDPDSFYGLNDSSKLNVIYYMLTQVREKQEKAYETITQNQNQIQNSNQRAFTSIPNSDGNKSFIYDVFKNRPIIQIPAMPVLSEEKTNSKNID